MELYQMAQKNNLDNSKRVCYWRILSIVCILTAWTVTVIAIPAPLFTLLPHAVNKSINSILLDRINLDNYTINCPEPYVFTPGAGRCKLKCGKYDISNPHLQLFRYSLLAIIAIINLGISLVAIVRWIIIHKQTKFQHHPIIIGVIVNLLESVTIGMSDLAGGNIFYCSGNAIDYDTFNMNPSIQLQIQGALITFLGLSNRLWFMMALVLILISIALPLRDIFGPRRNKLLIITLEVTICVAYPLVSAFANFVAFTGYKLSEEILLPVPANLVLNIISGIVPHLVISPLTLTLVVIIVYKIQSQMKRVSGNTNNTQKVQPLEKRLMFFSILYFLLNLVIITSFITKALRDNTVQEDTDNFLAYVTLSSTYQYANSVTTNQTLTLLPLSDRSSVEPAIKPFAVYIHGIGIRLEFILVLSVLNFSCQKWKCFKRKKNEIEVIQNKNVKV